MNDTFQITSCRDSQRISNILMIAVVLIGSIVGNGIISLLLIRFKTLRTVPNLLIANLAVVNILHAMTNMPLFILWYICKVPPLNGRSISWTVMTWYVLFLYLTVFNLTVLAMDRYGAIVHGLRYHTWKTKNKAKVAILVVWVLAALYTYGMFTLGLDIDLGDAPVLLYRMTYLKMFGRHFIIPGILLPFMIIIILGLAIWVKVLDHRKRLSTFLSVKIQIENDVKTAKTIGLTVLAYFCMNVIPMLLHNILRCDGSWPHFLAFLLMKLNSMVNPIIYALKASRFRRALALLFKEPHGRSEPNMNSRILNNLSSAATNLTLKTEEFNIEDTKL